MIRANIVDRFGRNRALAEDIDRDATARARLDAAADGVARDRVADGVQSLKPAFVDAVVQVVVGAERIAVLEDSRPVPGVPELALQPGCDAVVFAVHVCPAHPELVM
ncbi:hypothetical protein D3C72_1039640 [compost metagenome]